MMKNFRQAGCIAVALCGLMMAVPAHADINTIRNSDNEIWGSAGGYLFDYKEELPAPDISDKERDWIASAAVGINYMDVNYWYVAVENDVNFGNAHYNGSFFASPTTPLSGTTSETIWTIDGRLGKGVVLGSNLMLIPYAELGVRYWNRSLSSQQAENYRNLDALGGAMLQMSLGQRTVLSVYGSGGSTFSPRMNTGGFTYNLGSAAMFKAGGKLGYDFSQRFEIFTTVDYDHFRYGQSPVVNAAYEPNSHTDDTAVRVGLAYHFN